jgi:cytochrome c
MLRLTFVICLALSSAAHAQGDAARGEKVFATKCKACHTLEEGGANKVGPNLFGVIGRRAGSASFGRYSPAMIAAGKLGMIWDEGNFSRFAVDPNAFLVGATNMAGARSAKTFKLPNPQDVADVYAYLSQISPKGTP